MLPVFEDNDVVALRIRRAKQDDEYKRYIAVTGSGRQSVVLWQEQASVMIVESYLDAILVHQEAGDLVGVIALGSAQMKPDSELHKRLAKADRILVSLDADEPGAKASVRWLSEFSNAKRWSCVKGKDPGEMRKAGVPVRKWIEAIIENPVGEQP